MPANCNLLTQDCQAGEGCYVVDNDGHTDCMTAGTITEGVSCGQTADAVCAPGLDCLGTSAATLTCYKICATNGSVACAQGQTCQHPSFYPATSGICVTQ